MSIKGWVYVISNPAMPGLLKVGFSLKDPALRARELAHTGSPHPYKVEYEMLLENPRDAEQRAHSRLASFREGKEWFHCTLEQAISAVKAVASAPILLETQYASTKKFQEPAEPRKAVGAHSTNHSSTRPIGTYAGACSHCGTNVSCTLHPRDTQIKCPECFRLTDISAFKRHEFTL